DFTMTHTESHGLISCPRSLSDLHVTGTYYRSYLDSWFLSSSQNIALNLFLRLH
ncbi:hypothetical protein HAX54_011945, partial [Datura stramonium]|nr:hypothetical protein [Datura stramonium]